MTVSVKPSPNIRAVAHSRPLVLLLSSLACALFPGTVLAAETGTLELVESWVGITALILFAVAYVFVVIEEFTHLKKSKPVLLAAGIIWALVGYEYASHNLVHAAEAAVQVFLIEFAELFLFLLVAMTYVNAMSERNIFKVLRIWLVNQGYGYRRLFWT
ncbi:MAG: sodium:proton antiporter NhaD, partial [Proteobacteria bacterium]|nr:sodium:proton antiporter NhaD [Pseudomonadota bacterium]